MGVLARKAALTKLTHQPQHEKFWGARIEMRAQLDENVAPTLTKRSR
jgi:hypothetical protein